MKLLIGFLLVFVPTLFVAALLTITAAPDTQFALTLKCLRCFPKNTVENILNRPFEERGSDLFYVIRKADDGVSYWDGYRRYHAFTVHFNNNVMTGFNETQSSGMPTYGPSGVRIPGSNTP